MTAAALPRVATGPRRSSPSDPVPHWKDVLRWANEWPRSDDLRREYERVAGRWRVRVA